MTHLCTSARTQSWKKCQQRFSEVLLRHMYHTHRLYIAANCERNRRSAGCASLSCEDAYLRQVTLEQLLYRRGVGETCRSLEIMSTPQHSSVILPQNYLSLSDGRYCAKRDGHVVRNPSNKSTAQKDVGKFINDSRTRQIVLSSCVEALQRRAKTTG